MRCPRSGYQNGSHDEVRKNNVIADVVLVAHNGEDVSRHDVSKIPESVEGNVHENDPCSHSSRKTSGVGSYHAAAQNQQIAIYRTSLNQFAASVAVHNLLAAR